MNEVAQLLCGVLILLVPLAAAGLALTQAGLCRARSAAYAMLAPLCAMAAAMLLYCACGWSWQSFPAHAVHEFSIGGKSLIAFEPPFLYGLALDGSPASLAVWLQMFSVAVAALIPLGAGSERWRLTAACVSSALLAGWTYPLFAHWVWGGGWLAQIGLIDTGGASTIQGVGGLTALAVAMLLGPRQGKYDSEGIPAAFPGHNAVLVLFGCFLTWLGWIGLNGAGSILFGGFAAGSVVQVAMNTTLSAAAALLVAAGITRTRFGRPDASLCANGWTGGLVASSAAGPWVGPIAATAIGAIAGVLVALSVEWIDLRLHVDDPAGSISVHAVGGLWGLLAMALFGPGQWTAQLIGVATLVLVVLPMTYGLNRVLDRFCPLRVSAEAEPHGLDLHELGAGAYPDFVTRRDDFRPR